MNVGEVTKLIGGIARGLPDQAKKISEAFESFKAGMDPFADQTIEQFVGFLRQCEDYRRNGTIPVAVKPSKSRAIKVEMTVSQAEERIRHLLSEINRGTVSSPIIASLVSEIDAALTKPKWDELLRSLSFTGKAKSKSDAVERVRQMLNSQLEMYIKSRAFSEAG